MLKASIEAMNHQNTTLENIIKNCLHKIDISQEPNKEPQMNTMREATKKASLKLGLGENTKGVDKDLER